MKDVIELLKEMGAEDIVYDESNGFNDESVSFKYKDKQVKIGAIWCNTQIAEMYGSVEKMNKDDNNG